MFSTLRSRLWLTYALLVAVALTVATIILAVFLIIHPYEIRQLAAQMTLALNKLSVKSEKWASLPPARLQRFLREQDDTFGLRLLVYSPERVLLADSRLNSSPVLDSVRIQRVRRLYLSDLDENNQRWLMMTRRLPDGNYLVAAAPRPRSSILSILTDEFLPPIIWGGLIALALALMLAFWVARWVADPLQRLVNAAGQFPAQGARPLPLDGPREVREVVKAYNQMTARVQSSQDSQRVFVANVSHELKTPLTSIQGFAQAILDGAADTPEARRSAAQVIYDESSRMHRMVLDLLDLARFDAGMLDIRRDTVDMSALLANMVTKFAPRAEQAGVTMALEAANLPPIPGDGDRLAQVFGNLLDNALKFSLPGGKVTVSARRIDAWLEVLVSDTGVGIDPAGAAHIFERFYQADAARRGGAQHGAGLGLAIAKEIVRAHGGEIHAESTPGRGSVFSVRLPLK